MTGALNADMTSSGQGVGDLDLALDYEDLRLNINARLAHDDGSTMTALGYIPLDLRLQRLEEAAPAGSVADRSVDFSIAADSFSVGWIDPFLDPETITELEGRLTGNVDVSGTMESPIVDGNAVYTDGTVGLVVTDLNYRAIRADLLFEQNQVHISNLRLRSGDGSVSGEGSINLAELTLGEFDIDFVADNFLAVDSREYHAIVNGQMHLAGTTRRPVLEGGLEVINSDIYLTEQTTAPELERVELTQEDLQTVEARFGVRITEADTTTFDFFEALAMNLDLEIGRNTWIRSTVNPVMDVQFSGSLDLMKDHYADLRVFGTIDVVEQRSRIVQFGKRFSITSGTLTFNGPPEDPYVDIAAEYDVRTLRGSTDAVSITLSVTGQMSEQLDLILGSDPEMPYADIVSYIATGQPASASLQLGGIGGTGADLAVGQLTALIEGIAGSRLGLDVVTIEQTGGTPTVTAGKYVTSRLFVSVSQPIGDASNTVRGTNLYDENTPVITVEYEVQNWLLLRLLQKSSIIRMNLLVEHSY
jgi:translocation and assembly module TamB